MQSFILVVTGTTISDKFKPARAGISPNLAARVDMQLYSERTRLNLALTLNSIIKQFQ
jgi:hypothetical protein